MTEPTSTPANATGAPANSTPLLQTRSAALVIGVAGVVGLWLIDRSVTEQLRFYALYLLPIGLVAWRCGRLWAMLLAVMAVSMWAFGDPEFNRNWQYSFIPFWNAGMRLATFLAVGLIIARLRGAFEHERDLARTDQVTGAPNRHRFVEAADAELARARRYGRPFAVAYIDVDNFKQLNDSQGHDAGDAALRRTSEVIAASLRSTDTFARIGGDEFAILLPETAPEAAREVADRLRQELLDAAGRSGWPITFSVGVAGFQTTPRAVEDLLRLADELMYRAKQGGKNRIESRTFQA